MDNERMEFSLIRGAIPSQSTMEKQQEQKDERSDR